MKKIRVFETFAGIGSQHKALNILKNAGILDFEVVATSEWDMWANIAYNSIHHNNLNVGKNKEIKEMITYLEKFQHSYDSKKEAPISYIEKKPKLFIELLYSSFINSNNLGSITNISGEELISSAGHVDLITYSFPCQDLSMAGSFHGFNKGMAKGSGTRSGLLWEIERILTELDIINEKPEYLLLENVKNMISETHINDYKMWLVRLNELGYNTQTFVLKSSDYGSPQIRERVYAISKLKLSNPKFKDTLNSTKQIISNTKIDNNSAKYKINKNMWDILQVDYSNEKILLEALCSSPNRTPSRQRMFDLNPKLFTKLQEVVDNAPIFQKRKITLRKNGYFLNYCRTLTTKQDRHPNAGVVDLRQTIAISKLSDNQAKYRFITPREAYMLMGFESNDFNKITKYNLIPKEILYRQAGNSIVVNVLVAIFEYMTLN